MSATLIIGAENLIELGPPNGTSLQDTTDGTYPITATVIGSLYLGGVIVAGAGPLTLSYVNGTSGALTVYRAVIPDTVTLIEGAVYEFRAVATDASGNKRPFNLTLTAVKG
jgi:hypothetical protein